MGRWVQRRIHILWGRKVRILGALFKDMDVGQYLTSVNATQMFCKCYFVGWMDITVEHFVSVFPEPCKDLDGRP